MVWPFGKEDWCNLEGQYMHMVADLNHLKDTYDSYTMSVCSVAVYGTKYIRKGGEGAQLPTKVEFVKGVEGKR